MNRSDVTANWLSSGGAYGILGVVWLLTAVFYFTYAQRLGRDYDSPNDGCLLGFGTVVLTLTGGGLGLLLFQFPIFVVTSCIGAVLLPGLACVYFRRKMKSWRPR
jgi:hypothetical protein